MVKDNNLENTFYKNGYKFTSQRKAIIDVLTKNVGKFLTTYDIYEYVKNIFPKIGLTTIYRTVIILVKLKLAYKLNVDNKYSKYGIINEYGSCCRHHYLICTNCNKIIELDNNIFKKVQKKIFKKYGFKIQNHCLILYGKCKKCKKC